MSDAVLEVAVQLLTALPVRGQKKVWVWILSADGEDA
jgi:hypothetical protein